jgi:hypothetical protein
VPQIHSRRLRVVAHRDPIKCDNQCGLRHTLAPFGLAHAMLLLRRHAWLLTWFIPVAAVYFVWTHSDSVGWFGNDGPN